MNVRTKAILGITGIFLVGGLLGAGIVGLIVRNHVREAREIHGRDGFLRFVERRLELTELQRDSLRDELDSLYSHLTDLRQSTSVELVSLLDTFRNRIEPHLTPRQRELLSRQEEFMRHGLPRGRGRTSVPPRDGDEVSRMGGGPVNAGHNDRQPDSGDLRPHPDNQGSPIERPGHWGRAVGGSRPNMADADDSVGGRLEWFERRLDKVLKRLRVSPQQKSAIEAIVLEARARAQAIPAGGAGSAARRRSDALDIWSEARKRIVTLLTPAQREEFRIMRRKEGRRSWLDR